MNDKQQLAAMGEHMASMKLTIHGHGINSEEEASGGFLTRCLPCSSQQQQTPCTAKRIEELEAQVRALTLPEGWQLVPVTVTPEMFNASMKWDFWPIRPSNFQGLYDAMLAAAPRLEPKP